MCKMTNDGSNMDDNNLQTPNTPITIVDTTPQFEKKQQSEEDDSCVYSTDDEEPPVTCCQRLIKFYWQNDFLIWVIIVICVAKAYPPLGAEYLKPEITATWIAVIFIFFCAGLGLKTDDFRKAIKRYRFNAFVGIYGFFFVSSIVFGVAKLLDHYNVITHQLVFGMVLCGCLPMSVNMVIVLTHSSHGDDAAAVFNSAFSNMLGVFLAPALMLMYEGVNTDLNLGVVFGELTVRVLVPVIIGQIIQNTIKPIGRWAKSNKFILKQCQQNALVFIVYTVFCKTFARESQSSLRSIFLMILFQFLLMITFKIIAWYALRYFWPRNPRLRVMGLFGCTHKSVATGIPMITSLYGNDPAIGLYSLPVLIWHPMQLVVGSILAPHLKEFVAREQKRLGLDEHDKPLLADNQETAPSAVELVEEGRSPQRNNN